jgi:hypothetical protein
MNRVRVNSSSQDRSSKEARRGGAKRRRFVTTHPNNTILSTFGFPKPYFQEATHLILLSQKHA